MGIDEAATLAALKASRKELVDGKIAEHKGRIVKLTGDGMLVEFTSVVNAVACAVEIQRGMAGRNAGVPQDRRIEFRRLQLLRRWSHDKQDDQQVFSRGSRPRGANGFGS